MWTGALFLQCYLIRVSLLSDVMRLCRKQNGHIWHRLRHVCFKLANSFCFSNSSFHRFYTWTYWWKSLCTKKQNPGFLFSFISKLDISTYTYIVNKPHYTASLVLPECLRVLNTIKRMYCRITLSENSCNNILA